MSGCDAIVTKDLSGQLDDLEIWGYESVPQGQVASNWGPGEIVYSPVPGGPGDPSTGKTPIR